MQVRSTTIMVILSILLLSFTLIETSQSKTNTNLVQRVSEQFEVEINCLAQNIYYEAASEPYEGKLAVAQVTMNRTHNGSFPSTVCGVVNQKNNGSCQFTWVCEAKYAIRNKYEWEESQLVARMALTQSFVHDKIFEQKGIYYHADYVNPGWKKTKITQIGRHIFYK